MAQIQAKTVRIHAAFPAATIENVVAVDHQEDGNVVLTIAKSKSVSIKQVVEANALMAYAPAEKKGWAIVAGLRQVLSFANAAVEVIGNEVVVTTDKEEVIVFNGAYVTVECEDRATATAAADAGEEAGDEAPAAAPAESKPARAGRGGRAATAKAEAAPAAAPAESKPAAAGRRGRTAAKAEAAPAEAAAPAAAEKPAAGGRRRTAAKPEAAAEAAPAPAAGGRRRTATKPADTASWS